MIYSSPIFPTSSFAYAHDLKPELAKKLTDCFFDFRFTPEMTKEFNGDDRFFPITYQKDWAVVRDVAEKSGTPYNKAAYDAEAKREAEALAKKKAASKAPRRKQQSDSRSDASTHHERRATRAAGHEPRARHPQSRARNTAPGSRCCSDISLDGRRAAA